MRDDRCGVPWTGGPPGVCRSGRSKPITTGPDRAEPRRNSLLDSQSASDLNPAGISLGESQRQLRTEIARLRARLEGFLLPFWSTQGFETDGDLFHERFDFAGDPARDAPRRAMVQARQIYVFSHAALCGMLPEGPNLVERSLRTLLSRFCENGGTGFAFSLNRDGTVHSPVRDSYTHAFVLFALAWAARVTGEAGIRHAVDGTLGFMDRHLFDRAEGGLLDKHPEPAWQKSQNPQMHLLEAFLALHETFPEGPYLDRAGTIVDLFSEKILCQEPHVIPEVFGSDWSAHPETEPSGFFEPGHHFEWIWLLDWYDRLTARTPSGAGRLLWRTALDYGMARGGLVLDEVAFDFRPRKRTHRLWPHTEGVKAAAVRFSAGDRDASTVAVGMLRAVNEVFLGRPFPGGWVDRIGPDGRVLVETVPASSLYHLYGAWAEAERIFAPAATNPI